MKQWLLLVPTIVLLVGCDAISDSNMEKALIGSWDNKKVTPEGIVFEGRTTFIKGGIQNFTGTATKNGESIPIVASGTWKVKDGQLHYTVDRSNIPQVIPNGFTSADKIVSVDDKESIYVDSHHQETIVETRVK